MATVMPCGPASMPAEAKDALEKAMLEAMKSPLVSARLAAGGVTGALDSEGFADKLAMDVAFWGPQIKKLGITAE